MVRLLILVLSAAFVSLPALGQSSRYSTWSNPDQQGSVPSPQSTPAPASDTRLQDFINKLNGLIDEAEKARAADPRFLRDLRDLASGFDRPWSRLVMSDDFADGDATNNPTWTTTQGTYFVERGWGLRNKVVAGAAAEPERKLTQEEKALQLFGALLGGKVTTSSSTASGPQPTDIHVPANVANAFAVEAEIYSVLTPGTFAVTLYQGSSRNAGYRLVYVADKGIELQRYTSRGTAVVDATRTAIKLEDKKFHRLDWTRGADGVMIVSVDGNEVLKTTDRSFRDPFAGLELSTRGGDFIVKRVAVYEAP